MYFTLYLLCEFFSESQAYSHSSGGRRSARQCYKSPKDITRKSTTSQLLSITVNINREVEKNMIFSFLHIYLFHFFFIL